MLNGINTSDTGTCRAAACEVASFAPLSDIGAGAVVATRSVVTGVKLLAEDPSVAVLALAEEGALRNVNKRMINSDVKSMSLGK